MARAALATLALMLLTACGPSSDAEHPNPAMAKPPQSCMRAEPQQSRIRLDAIHATLDVEGARWLVGAQEDTSKTLNHALVYLDAEGAPQTRALPRYSEEFAYEGGRSVRMIDPREALWWRVHDSGDGPRADKPQPIADLPAGPGIRAFASNGRYALITLYRNTGSGYRGETGLYSVPDGREIKRANDRAVWTAGCGPQACFGLASLANPAEDKQWLVTLDPQKLKILDELDERACGAAVQWKSDSHWILARPIEQGIALHAIPLTAPFKHEMQRVTLSRWPLDTLRKAVRGRNCMTLEHTRLADRHGLLVRNGERGAFLPIDAQGRAGTAERLPTFNGSLVTIAPLLGAGLLLDVTNEKHTRTTKRGSKLAREHVFMGFAGLLEPRGSDWGWAKRQELPTMVTMHRRNRPDAGALSRDSYAATVVVGYADPARVTVWTEPCD